VAADFQRFDNKLDEVIEKLNEVHTAQMSFRTEIMGSDGKGRVPALEVEIKDVKKDVLDLKRFRWTLLGGSVVGLWVVEKLFHNI
jgi:hypothetical protein